MCACGTIQRHEITSFGSVIEVCGCGKRSALRGRTLEDVERDDAAFRARSSERPNYRIVKTCAWPGCNGSASNRTKFCPPHGEERRRTAKREHMRRIAARRKLSLRSGET